MSKLETTDYQNYISFLPGGKGISMADNTPFPAWQEAVRVCGSIVADGLWALGDLFLGGEEQYGQEASQALESMKYSAKTISNAIWVCKTYPPSRRIKGLTFNHHAVCASLEDKPARDAILREAEEKEMTVKEITELKKAKFPSSPRKTNPKKPSETSQDAPQEAASPETTDGSQEREVTQEVAIAAMETLCLFLTSQGKNLSVSTKASMDEGMSNLGRLARRIGFMGGNRSGHKKKA